MATTATTRVIRGVQRGDRSGEYRQALSQQRYNPDASANRAAPMIESVAIRLPHCV